MYPKLLECRSLMWVLLLSSRGALLWLRKIRQRLWVICQVCSSFMPSKSRVRPVPKEYVDLVTRVVMPASGTCAKLRYPNFSNHQVAREWIIMASTHFTPFPIYAAGHRVRTREIGICLLGFWPLALSTLVTSISLAMWAETVSNQAYRLKRLAAYA